MRAHHRPLCVVIGAAGALGSACVRRFTLDDWDVVSVDVTPPPQPDTVFIQADVRDQQTLDAIAADLGPISTLVNTHAAWPAGEDAAAIEPSDWTAMIEVNLSGTFRSCKAFFGNLARRGGTIINLASVTGHHAFRAHAAYCGANAAIVALGHVLALEWGKHGIRVITVSPGTLRSPVLEAAWDAKPGREAEVLATIPQGRLADVTEVADAIAKLTDPGFAFMTGAAVILDGGLTVAGGY